MTREEAIKLIPHVRATYGTKDFRRASYTASEWFKVVKKALQAEPIRHGHWIRDEFGSKCGACGLYAYRDKFDSPWESPYCPNCGAKMG